MQNGSWDLMVLVFEQIKGKGPTMDDGSLPGLTAMFLELHCDTIPSVGPF